MRSFQSSRAARIAVLALGPLLVGPFGGGGSHLRAQEGPAATIEEILALQAGGRGAVVPGLTDRVLVMEAGVGRWTQTQPPRPLRLRDQLLVEPRTIVRVALRSGDGEGRAHLNAEPETARGPVPIDAIGGSGRGLYEIGESPDEPGRLEIRVAQGSVALNWLRGRMDLWAAGWRMAISGTRVVLAVSEDGERAAIHLVEGSVEFPEAPDFSLRPGETALLQSGIPPVLYTGPQPLPGQLAEAAEWSSRGAWPGRSPWIYVGAAAGAVTAGYFIGSRVGNGSGSGSRTGTVIIRLPF